MALKTVAISLAILLLVATTSVASAQLNVTNRNTFNTTPIVSEADATTIWNFLIHGETDDSITFELLMESDTPVYAIFEVMDSEGVTTSLDAAPVLPGRAVQNLGDLKPVVSKPLEVGKIDDTFLTINIFLFKDPDYTLLYDNGHIVTIFYGGYNCYQQETWCLHSYRSSFGTNEIKYPYGWGWDVSPDRPGFSYNRMYHVMSQNVARHFEDLPTPVRNGPDFSVSTGPASVGYGQPISASLSGQFTVATVLLYHVDVNGTVSLVAVEQLGPDAGNIIFNTAEDLPTGEYWLHVNVLDGDGNKFPYKFEYQLG